MNEIPPSVNRSIPPDFHRMDEHAFEEMSCALYQEESRISTADLYRRKFQRQFGIDIIATRIDGTGIEVASCKCYSTIKKGQIPQWGADFLTHWDSHWKAKKVHKIVLIVASDVNSEEREIEIDAEKARFESYGVTYDVWGPRQLQNKLHKHRGIVSRYLDPWWADRLCGSTQNTASASVADTGIMSASIIAQISSLQKHLSGSTEKQLETAFEEIQRGNLNAVETQLLDIRTGEAWAQLLPEVQARVIRLQASLALQRGNIDYAEKLADEADHIHVPKELRLRALIATRRDRSEKGLEILGIPASRDGVQLRVAMLLDAGRLDDAITTIEHSPIFEEPHAETERLKAFIALLQGDRERAFEIIRHAEKLKSDWPSIQRAGAMIRYALALSPVLTSEWYLYPNPIDLDLVRDDNNSHELLTEALERFENLASQAQDDERKRIDQTWALACLCNLRNRLDDAELRCKQILADEPTHTGAVDWALARGFDFDRDASKRQLQESLERGNGDSEQVTSLAWLNLVDGNNQAAIEIMTRYADRFNTPKLQQSHATWLADFTAREKFEASNSGDAALTVASKMSVLVERANQSKDWTPLEGFLEEIASLKPTPAILLRAAQMLASTGRWHALGKHLDLILSFGTAEAVRIAVYTAFNTQQLASAIQLLDTHKSKFRDSKIPHELMALKAEAFAQSGKTKEALHCANLLAAETSAFPHRMLKATLQLNTGNIGGSLSIIREAAQAKKLSSQNALQLSRMVALEDVDLARSLLCQAIEKGLPRELSMHAFELANRLGLQREAGPLVQIMGELAQQGSPLIKIVSVEEITDLLRIQHKNVEHLYKLYLDGVLPVHVFSDQSNADLAHMYCLAETSQPTTSGPLLIRHGGRPAHHKLKAPITKWRLHIDVTGLLLACQLGLLDTLEQLPHPLIISPALPIVLMKLEQEQPKHAATWLTSLRRRVAQGIENERYVTLASVSTPDNDEADDTNQPVQPLLKCVYDLLNVQNSENSVLWFDDRALSGYQNSQNNPIVGIYEVLNALLAAKLIAESDRYDALRRLRDSNAMFVPFEPDEILHHLAEAQIINGRVIETTALSSIRRNFSHALLLEDHIKLDESMEQLKGRPDEIQFLFEIQGIVARCVVAQWVKPDLDDEMRNARATWLWSSLRTDRFYRLPKHVEAVTRNHAVLALNICTLLTGMIQLVTRNVDSVEIRLQSYRQCLQRNIIDYRLEKDEALLQSIAGFFSPMLMQLIDDAAKNKSIDLEGIRSLMRMLVNKLPETIMQKLLANKAFCQKLGIKMASVVTMGGLDFEADQLWPAISKAVINGKAHVKTLKGSKQLTLKRDVSDKNSIRLTGALTGNFSDSVIGLLDKSSAQRRNVLLANPDWLDIPPVERKALVENIVATALPADRLKMLQEMREISASFFYSCLEGKLEQREQLSLDAFMPPPATSLINHLRLPSDQVLSFPEKCAAASNTLISERGWMFAFSRLAGIPVALPEPVVEAVQVVSETHYDKIVAMLIEQKGSPLQMIQALSLLVRITPKEVYHKHLNDVLEGWHRVSKPFVSVLRWTEFAFQNDDTWTQLPVSERLALVWMHADRVIRIFVSQQIDLEQVETRFADHLPSRPVEQTMRFDSMYDESPVNPRSIDDAAILYFGLRQVLQDRDANQFLLEEHIEKISNLLMIDTDNSRILSPWLFMAKNTAFNQIGSYFVKPPIGLFNESEGPNEQHIAGLQEKAFADLETEPNSAICWSFMRLFMTSGMTGSQREKMSAIATRLNLVEMVSRKEADITLMQVIGTCILQIGASESRIQFIEQLIKLAAYYSDKYPGEVQRAGTPQEDPRCNALWQLVEGAASVSRSIDLTEAFGGFGNILVDLAKAWPGATSLLREVADNTIRSIRTEHSGQLWKSFLQLRAIG
ncbi:MAG: hypothetical protein JJE30_05305 [Desulfuromonadales bacterium]|nr:hypothetical protein [Desulfuromonadales bacterium]